MQVTWVDILVLSLILKGVSSGRNSDILTEFFNVLGVFFATVITLHYYVRFGIFLKEKLFFPADMEDFISFGLLAIVIPLAFFLIREGWQIILKFEFPLKVDQWGGFIFSCVKTVFVLGLLITSLLVFGNRTIVSNVTNSVSGLFFTNISISIYRYSYNELLRRVSPSEPVNVKIIEIARSIKQKSP